jgi:hypothetical protein
VFNMRYLLPLILALLVSSAAYAVVVTLASSSIDQLGGGEEKVSPYHVRVLSASINVDSNVFNNQITGGSLSVATSYSTPLNYVLTITLSSGANTRTVTMTATLSPTPTTVTFTLSTPLPYSAPGVTISVRADPA